MPFLASLMSLTFAARYPFTRFLVRVRAKVTEFTSSHLRKEIT
jgi:hypothetical protein